MTDKKKEKPDKPTDEEYLITTSDWIVYLESKSTRNVSVYLGILSVFVIVLIYLSTSVKDILIFLITIASFYIFWVFVDKSLQKKIKPIQDLSEDIILGKITDTKEIRERYKDYLKKYPKKNKIL